VFFFVRLGKVLGLFFPGAGGGDWWGLVRTFFSGGLGRLGGGGQCPLQDPPPQPADFSKPADNTAGENSSPKLQVGGGYPVMILVRQRRKHFL